MRQTMLSDDAFLSAFCHELSFIMRTGATAKAGLEIMRDSESSDERRELLSELCDRTNGRTPLWQAMEKTGMFPDYMVRMLELADRADRVNYTLLQLSEYYKRRRDFKSAVLTALLYPGLLFAVFLVTIYIVSTRVVPVFESIFRHSGITTPVYAQQYFVLGRGLSILLTIAAILIIFIIIASVVIVLAKPLREKTWAWLLERFGGVGSWGELMRAQFAAALAITAAGGFTADESLTAASRFIGSSLKMDELLNNCRDILMRDGNLPLALSESGMLSAKNGRLLALAMENGKAEDVLLDIAQDYESRARDKIIGIAALVEPAIVILGTFAAGTTLLSVLLPLAASLM